MRLVSWALWNAIIDISQEISHYITTIERFWKHILASDIITMRNTDSFTVECIQLRAPALSKSDFQYIKENMESRELFPGVTDAMERAEITARLLATEEIIPSLWTLISNIRYLKQPAKTLKTLLPKKSTRKDENKKKRKKTLRERFHSYFTRIELSWQLIEI